MNCTVASEETRKLFALDVKEFDALAAKAPIGADGVVYVPFFSGERTPNLPNGRACICGLSGANSSRENIARAALESAIFGMRAGLEAFEKLGFKAREIRITGGGAKSPLWRKIAADVMNHPVKRPANDESAALGAAIQALWCLLKREGNPVPIASLTDEHILLNERESITPDPAGVEAYNKAYAQYTQYVKALTPLFI
jgi:xylulokinase